MLVEIVLINSVAAALLALLATVLSRWVRRPAILHVLWLLVLLKLVTPPIFRVEALPGLGAVRVGPLQVVETVALRPPGAVISSPLAVERAHPLRASLAGIAGWAWIGGSVFLLGLIVVRCARFRRLVRGSRPAPPPLRRRVEWLAERLGLRRCPALRVIEGRLPPMLWSRPGPGELFLPAGLLRRLGPAELDAHVRRRDHWVRWIEASVIVLFWWNPVTWWARRNLRIAEEKSCDAWVLELLPGESRSYAEGILKTVDYISGARPRIPMLATGAAETRHLKERLTMIMSQERPLRTRSTQRWALAMLALAMLLVFPTFQQGPAAAAEAGAGEAGEDESHRHALLALEHEALELEYRLSRLQAQRMEIEQEIEREVARAKLDAMRRHGEELRREGREEEAALMERKLLEQERRRDLEADMLSAQLEHQFRMRRQEYELHRMALALEGAKLSSDPARAEALESEVRQLELELRRAVVEELRRREQLEQESLSVLELETRAQGLATEAERQQQYRRLDRLAAELLRKLDAIERAGVGASASEATELEQAARDLRRVLETLEDERRSSGVRCASVRRCGREACTPQG